MAIDEVSEETLDTEPEINVIQHPEQKFPEPLSRTERLLTKIAEIGAQIAENTGAAPSERLLICNATIGEENSITLDKTYAEIAAAGFCVINVPVEDSETGLEGTIRALVVFTGTDGTAYYVNAVTQNDTIELYTDSEDGYPTDAQSDDNELAPDDNNG